METHARGQEKHTGRFNGAEGGSVVDGEGGGEGKCGWGKREVLRIGKEGENRITWRVKRKKEWI